MRAALNQRHTVPEKVEWKPNYIRSAHQAPDMGVYLTIFASTFSGHSGFPQPESVDHMSGSCVRFLFLKEKLKKNF